MTSLACIFFLTLCQGIGLEVMFGAHFGFFAIVSDPRLGGTYMTLLSAVHNLGNAWVVYVCLKASDNLQAWTGYDGYLLLSCACTVGGFVWFLVAGKELKRLQSLPLKSWRLASP